LSILKAVESLAEPPALCAWQLDVAPAVSVTKFCMPQPESITTADCASMTLQVTLTSLVYQLFKPRVPVTTLVMTGGVVSPAGAETVRFTWASAATPVVLASGSLEAQRALYVYVPGVVGAPKERVARPVDVSVLEPQLEPSAGQPAGRTIVTMLDVREPPDGTVDPPASYDSVTLPAM